MVCLHQQSGQWKVTTCSSQHQWGNTTLRIGWTRSIHTSVHRQLLVYRMESNELHLRIIIGTEKFNNHIRLAIQCVYVTTCQSGTVRQCSHVVVHCPTWSTATFGTVRIIYVNHTGGAVFLYKLVCTHDCTRVNVHVCGCHCMHVCGNGLFYHV